MYPIMAACFLALIFLEISRTVVSTCIAGIAFFAIGIVAARKDVVQARGVDKIVALHNLCFAIPLAVFGAEHLSGANFIRATVPVYMPWRLFWAYFVGVALVAASLSIATKIQVRWSGLLFGIMIFLFVVMIHTPNVLANPKDRIRWVVEIRDLSFAGGGWVLAANAMTLARARARSTLFTMGRLLIAAAAIFFAVEEFLHPTVCPAVPLAKLMPEWIPARPLIGYLTGAIQLAAGVCILLAKHTRIAASYFGGWIVLLVLSIYGPILIASLMNLSTVVEVEGINYFADTLLFGGVILAIAATDSPSVRRP